MTDEEKEEYEFKLKVTLYRQQLEQLKKQKNERVEQLPERKTDDGRKASD